jgi:predicted GNAT family N-acyltransferase
MNDIRIREAVSPSDRERAFAVRTQVFQNEQGVPAELEFDDDDDRAVHFVAQAGGVVVGTARIVWGGDYAKIGRMAVLRQWRGRGIGRGLLDAAVERARQQGKTCAVLNAQTQAMELYAKAGFTAVGEEFEEAGILHRRMEKQLL